MGVVGRVDLVNHEAAERVGGEGGEPLEERREGGQDCSVLDLVLKFRNFGFLLAGFEDEVLSNLDARGGWTSMSERGPAGVGGESEDGRANLDCSSVFLLQLSVLGLRTGNGVSGRRAAGRGEALERYLEFEPCREVWRRPFYEGGLHFTMRGGKPTQTQTTFPPKMSGKRIKQLIRGRLAWDGGCVVAVHFFPCLSSPSGSGSGSGCFPFLSLSRYSDSRSITPFRLAPSPTPTFPWTSSPSRAQEASARSAPRRTLLRRLPSGPTSTSATSARA